jgi:hypothetical protein
MGYLALKERITVNYGNGVSRTFLPGVNKDVSQEEAEHWYVKAAGGEYHENVADAHRGAPEMKNLVSARRAEWEQAQRAALLAAIGAQSLRSDLEKLEKDMGVDTKKADAAFRESIKDEESRMKKLISEAEEADAVQKEQDAKSALTPAESEKIAAGSEEVANTEMDGPAKAEAERQVEETGKTIIGDKAVVPGTPAAAVATKVEANKEEVKAGHPTGQGTTSAKK